jgi:hypothetical protein
MVGAKIVLLSFYLNVRLVSVALALLIVVGAVDGWRLRRRTWQNVRRMGGNGSQARGAARGASKVSQNRTVLANIVAWCDGTWIMSLCVGDDKLKRIVKLMPPPKRFCYPEVNGRDRTKGIMGSTSPSVLDAKTTVAISGIVCVVSAMLLMHVIVESARPSLPQI